MICPLKNVNLDSLLKAVGDRHKGYVLFTVQDMW